MFTKHLTIVTILMLLLLLSCSETTTSADEDKENPTVSITNPLTNTEWDEGTTITIKAEAVDDEGISKVDFYIDGIVEFSDNTAEYSYEWNTTDQIGDYSLIAKAYDTNDNVGNSELIYVKIINEIPQASFTVTPSSGDISTVFQVDASACSDREDDVAALKVRWDWEADGTWDTDYSTTKTADHMYASDGTMSIMLEVKDTDGQTDTTSLQIIVDSVAPGVVTDVDGNEYTTVKIGNQWWMVENLRVAHYRDGTSIPLVYSNSSWALATKGAYCYYDLNSNNITEYGLLYNFHAVDNNKGLAPEGWHVASSEEWKELEMYLGMTQEQADLTLWRGTDEGGKLKETGTVHWSTPNTGATNETGFTAIPGGYRRGDNALYEGIGTIAYFWTSTGTTSSNSTYALTRALGYNEARISRTGSLRVWGFSVRCVKD